MQSTAYAAVLLVGAAVLGVAGGNGSEWDQPTATPYRGVLDEHPVIQYAQRPTRDRVSALNRGLAEASVSFEFEAPGGYLRPVLNALDIPVESQLLVFAKTGVQRAATSPLTPRAIFFDDSVVIGYIPGARWLELAAHDPQQGVVFYTIDQTPSATPRFSRRMDCLTCHVSASTLEVPGMIARSHYMSADGDVIPQLGFHIVNHRTPLPNRWGGWYVTGNYASPPYGGVGHMGNVTTSVHPSSGPVATSNEVFIQWLNSAPQTRGYTAADSDVAALMVFDHQMHAINLLTRLGWESRVAAHTGRMDFSGGPLGERVDELTDYFLFVDDVPPPAGLRPRQGFAERFTAALPPDRHGRSLRQLQAATGVTDVPPRLFRYPFSYMIYADAFESLPEPARTAVYQRMWAILSGRETSAKYSHLSAADRRAIVEILRDTKKELPGFFGPA